MAQIFEKDINGIIFEFYKVLFLNDNTIRYNAWVDIDGERHHVRFKSDSSGNWSIIPTSKPLPDIIHYWDDFGACDKAIKENIQSEKRLGDISRG